MPTKKLPLFHFGQLAITPAALEKINEAGDHAWHYLERHLYGDWGDVNAVDAKENELSVKNGYRIVSVYHTSNGDKFWIITEADRSVTTILLPEEY